jgi:hypothetical protein
VQYDEFIDDNVNIYVKITQIFNKYDWFHLHYILKVG